MIGQSRIVEGWMDMLMLVTVLFSAVAIATIMWSEEINLRQAERIVSEFLAEASADACVTAEQYANFKSRLSEVDTDYRVEFSQRIRLQYPIYECPEEAELSEYYARRNVRKVIPIEVNVEMEEKAEENRLQDFSNESLLAGKQGEFYLPLPDEKDGGKGVRAVLETQKVYVDEPLVTLCCIEEGGTAYLVEAENMQIDRAGKYRIELTLQGRGSGVFLDVTVYERSIICEEGHCYANTKERIEYYETYGVLPDCPYCEKLPECITFQESIIYTTTGTPLSETGLCAQACYRNGRKETIRPGCEGWQDNYDAEFCGVQQVTVTYNGRTSYGLTVITAGEKCRKCNEECKFRNHTDYVNAPLCNRCLSEIPRYTGRTETLEYILGQDAFSEALGAKEQWILRQGSSLQIILKKKGTVFLVKEAVIRSRMEE
ncbi:MAG: hypothetical protein ACI4FZ_10540 [Lachnospiraceae bacterium]